MHHLIAAAVLGSAAALVSNTGSAADCSGLPLYSAGSAYAAGERVKNIVQTSGQTEVFICNIAGWCSSSGAWAYEPGNGAHWELAWSRIDTCSGGGGSNQSPVANANGPYRADTGALINFSSAGSGDADGSITAYRWDFGDGATGNDANPSYRYTTAGTYTVSLTVTDDRGASTSASTTATISQPGTDPDPVPNPQPYPGGGYQMSRANIAAVEAHLTDSPLFRQVKNSIVTRGNETVEQVAPGRATNPDNVRRVEGIVNATTWDFTFPIRNASYNYRRFLQAVAKFPAFCGAYDDGRDADAICRKSLATMFAHFAQETGAHNPSAAYEQWRQGLFYLRELGCSDGAPGCGYNAECAPTTWQGQTWPCGRDGANNFKKYYGRGAKQLSYNYNYGPFSQAMFGDIRVLLDDPDRVARTWLNLASAVFFYVYPQPPKPSMLHVIDGTWQPNAHDLSLGLTPGFGVTTHIINGGIECGKPGETAQSLNRIAYYLAHANNLTITVPNSEQLGCAGMGRFDSAGAGALLTSWEQDWAYYPDRPQGRSFACKLVTYQTSYNALLPGDYEKCVEHYFDVTVVD
ncbi:PKD domain-containing protein [Exilibacterium tricleocarpae]|uniref:PKD domain-containing protein n=1 Tax=Exilibacterium tricleocarpae TaxID=2591008 RepID=A0A545SRR6_9GAMM|nr:glycoside hydrolase family 19 protein [Exilibacterium tricleocarpae]TQV67671.1 PKD domain-containing protein [Exilibacterium tricleocarpae]